MPPDEEVWHRILRARLDGWPEIDLSAIATDELLAAFAAPWPHLRYLHLGGCKHITDAGLANIANLTGLWELDLSGCDQITDAGLANIAKLTTLEHLDLGGCKQITDAGLANIADLTALRALRLWGCHQITGEEWGNIATLTTLEQLDLRWCEQITDAGLANIGELSGLQWLGLGGCRLTRLPEFLRELDLKRLDVTGNPDLDLPGDVVSQVGNPQAILEHYFGREQPLHEVKLLLLGEGAVGKTHVRMRLIEGQPAYFNPHEDRTHDIAMRRWLVPVDLGHCEVQVLVRAWDFGGQPHLHGSHRFFLSDERNLYLLVLDATRDQRDNRLTYWLRLIHSYSDNAPVVVLVTKCDAPERKLDPIDAQDLRDRTGANVVTVVDGYGRSVTMRQRHEAASDQLAQAITRALPLVNGIEHKYPRRFFDVRRCLEETLVQEKSGTSDGHKYVRVNRAYAHACKEHGLSADLARLYLPVYRNMGLIHYVGDHRQVEGRSELEDFVFSPDWVKGPVYHIIQSSDGARCRGVLSRDQVAQLLPSHDEHPNGADLWERLPFADEDRRRIVNLMKVCELCFDVSGAPATSLLVPDLLPPRTPARWRRWDKPDVSRAVHSACFLPESLLLRYIGRRYGLVQDPDIECWRDEIVIRDRLTPCEAVIQLDVEAAEIMVQVRGGTTENRDSLHDRIYQELAELQNPLDEDALCLHRGQTVTQWPRQRWSGLGDDALELMEMIAWDDARIRDIQRQAEPDLRRHVDHSSFVGCLSAAERAYDQGLLDGAMAHLTAMARVVYDRIKDHYSWVYTWEPYDPADLVQRIRQIDEIHDSRRGTCIDLALVYTACLETGHYCPLYVHLSHASNLCHALAGYWLIPTAECLKHGKVLGGQELLDHVRAGRIGLVDCRCFADGDHEAPGLSEKGRLPFATAQAFAMGFLNDPAWRVEFALNVRAARA